jgi:hypothetical protein
MLSAAFVHHSKTAGSTSATGPDSELSSVLGDVRFSLKFGHRLAAHLNVPTRSRCLGSTFIWFSDDRWLFAFLLVHFVLFVLVIVVVWVLRWQAQRSDKAQVD